MTTPNTEIKRFDPALTESEACTFSLTMEPSTQGDWVYYHAHLAALSRAREDARREARIEAVKDAAMVAEFAATVAGSKPQRAQLRDVAYRIRLLLPYTPQGETKEKS